MKANVGWYVGDSLFVPRRHVSLSSAFNVTGAHRRVAACLQFSDLQRNMYWIMARSLRTYH